MVKLEDHDFEIVMHHFSFHSEFAMHIACMLLKNSYDFLVIPDSFVYLNLAMKWRDLQNNSNFYANFQFFSIFKFLFFFSFKKVKNPRE